MQKRGCKRGQYLTLDAFIALMVVASGLILLLTINSFTPSAGQPSAFSQDFINTLSQARISELNNQYVKAQVNSGNITNTDNTLLQQVAEMYTYNMKSIASEMLANITPGIIPSQYKYNITLDGMLLYGRGTGQDTSDIVISSRRLVFGVVNKSAEFWGPRIVEVKVWQ